MGDFEDFVNANLGKRLPQLEDSGHPSSSSVAAGILGTRYLDTDNNDLYEKTGHDNTNDWVKIGKLGDTRGGAGSSPDSPNFSIQFNENGSFGGSSNLLYSGEQLSGASGLFREEFVIGTGLPETTLLSASGELVEVSGNLKVEQELYVSGNGVVTGASFVSPNLILKRAGGPDISINIT